MGRAVGLAAHAVARAGSGEMNASPAPNRRRAPSPRIARLLAVSMALAIAGCASVRYESTGRTPDAPVCQRPGAALVALVVWEPRWRADQKDVPDREIAAARGIERHFAGSTCYATAHVIRADPARPISALDGDGAAALARAQPSPSDRVVLLTVRELGPVLRIGGPGAIEGGTEVVIDVRVHDVAGTREIADFRAHWRHGGPGVIKGVRTLGEDMAAALAAAFVPSPAR